LHLTTGLSQTKTKTILGCSYLTARQAKIILGSKKSPGKSWGLAL